MKSTEMLLFKCNERGEGCVSGKLAASRKDTKSASFTFSTVFNALQSRATCWRQGMVEAVGEGRVKEKAPPAFWSLGLSERSSMFETLFL